METERLPAEVWSRFRVRSNRLFDPFSLLLFSSPLFFSSSSFLMISIWKGNRSARRTVPLPSGDSSRFGETPHTPRPLFHRKTTHTLRAPHRPDERAPRTLLPFNTSVLVTAFSGNRPQQGKTAMPRTPARVIASSGCFHRLNGPYHALQRITLVNRWRLVSAALHFAAELHHGQQRKAGGP